MADKILVFYGSYRSDRLGVLLAGSWSPPCFADDLAWWTEAARQCLEP